MTAPIPPKDCFQYNSVGVLTFIVCTQLGGGTQNPLYGKRNMIISLVFIMFLYILFIIWLTELGGGSVCSILYSEIHWGKIVNKT